MNNLYSDFLVIGAGIIGVNIALELVRQYPDSKVMVIDKEELPGVHGSGRNSGVLHAGFYYSEDSLKAKFTRNGNRMLTEYCLERNLPINQCGKLVVAKDENDLKGLNTLFKRARTNNIIIEELDEQAAEEIEPRVKTFSKALFSPTTSSVDPNKVLLSLIDDLKQAGVEVLMGVEYLGHSDNKTVKTSIGNIEAGYVVNASGLYADRIAKTYGFSENYRVIPFKGLYLYSNEAPEALNVHVYPVPDLKHPFLGVHYTITVDGKIKIGPTAIPAFWRENYNGFSRFQFDEFIEIAWTDLSLMISNNFGFNKLAIEEMKKYSRNRMVKLAGQLVENVLPEQFTHWGKPGIRAQLVDLKNRNLVMDFCYEGDEKSFHILNAVSPAFTCSMSFSKFIVEEISKKLTNQGNKKCVH